VWTSLVGILFALPNALMTAELATAFPVDGGAVVWTADACGPRIGGHNCYWVWLANLLDAAVYPQIAAKYVTQALKLGEGGEQAICAAMVVCVAVTNCMGLDWVTASQSVVFFLSLFPSLLFIAIGLGRVQLDVLASLEGEYDWALLISWALWLYSGFSSLGSMAGEVQSPKSVYPAVVAILLPLVSLLNILPFAVALSIDPESEHYEAGYFGTLAGRLSGSWLRTLFILGANLSQVGLYHSQVLAAERTCAAFADAHLSDLGLPLIVSPAERGPPVLPRLSPSMNEPPLVAPTLPPWHHRCCHAASRWLQSEPEGGGTCRGNVLFNAMVAGCLTQVHLEALVEVEMMLYALSHVLFLYSFVALRVQRPMAERAFRLPGHDWHAVAYCCPPLSLALGALVANLFSSAANTAALLVVMLVGLLGHGVGNAIRSWRAKRAQAHGTMCSSTSMSDGTTTVGRSSL